MIPAQATDERVPALQAESMLSKLFSRFRSAIRHRFKPDRLLEADGLRGIAMMFVFFYHFRQAWLGSDMPSAAGQGWLRLVFVGGGIGTDFFMLLSGFFSYRTWHRGTSGYVSFVKRRVYRVYPLFFLVSLFYIAVSILFPVVSRLPTEAGAATVYVLQSLLLLPGILPIRPLMAVAWTMSWIVLFYFLTPAISRTLDRVGLTSRQRTWMLAIAAVVWTAVAEATAWMPPRTAVFLVGMSLSEEFLSWTKMGANRLAWTSTGAWLGLSLAAVMVRGVVLLDPTVVGAGRAEAVAALATAIAIASFVWSVLSGPPLLQRIFSWSPLVWLGVISYSFYLTHALAIKFVRLLVFPELRAFPASSFVFWLPRAVSLILAIALALAVYLLVEHPVAVRLSRPSGPRTIKA